MMKLWRKWVKERFQYSQPKTLRQRDVLIFVFQQGWLFLVLILITFIAGVNYANNLILGFCFLISAILCISFYITFKQLHGLNIELLVDDLGQVGVPIKLRIYLSQLHPQRRYLYLRMGDEIHKISFHSHKHVLELSILATRRGKLTYSEIQIFSVYPFGLVRAWTYLYPQQFTWIAPSAKDLLKENSTMAVQMYPDLDQFRELRNYIPGDALQAISWKQVARGQGWFVKKFEQHQHIREINIDYQAMPSLSHEEKLQYMMGFVEQCEQHHCAYNLILPNAQLDFNMGTEQLRRASQLLAQA